MNLYAAIMLIGSFLAFCLAGLVIGRDPKNRVYQAFSAFALTIASWQFCIYMISISKIAETAFMWIKIHEIFLVFIPSSFFYFVAVFTYESRGRKSIDVFTGIGFLGSTVFLLLSRTPLLSPGVTKYSFGYYPTTAIGNKLFGMFFMFYMLLGAYELLKGFQASEGFKRNQVKYVLTASVLGLSASMVNFLPFYGIEVSFPIGGIGTPLATSVVAYAILRHHLLDIDIIIRQSIIYSILTAVLAASYVGVVFILQNIFSDLSGYSSIASTIVVALIIALTFVPVQRKVQEFVDRTFFKRKYQYQDIMKKAGKEISALDNATLISTYLVEIIADTMQISIGRLLLMDRQSETFIIESTYPLANERKTDIKFDSESTLVECLKRKSVPIFLNSEREKVFNRHVDRNEREMLETLMVDLIVPLQGKNELVGILLLGKKKSGNQYNYDDIELINALCNQAATGLENLNLYDELQASYINTVRSLVTALEAKDEYTKGHSERVANYAKETALELGISGKEAQLLYEVALMHDVGKIGISESILNKPEQLSSDEFDLIRSHAVIGEKILSRIESLKDGLSAVRHHHERLNGDGYPDGLSQLSIPIQARILSVADAYDAMTTKRPYRPAMSDRKAVEELKSNSCEQFDPRVVRAFMVVLTCKNEWQKNSILSLSSHKRRKDIKSA